MSIRTKFTGITTVDYRESFRDFVNGRRWNKTTQTWKTTVATADAKAAMAEQASPFKGCFRGTHTGMGTPGTVRRYVHNEASTLVVWAENKIISDGNYLNSPDAADTTNAAKLRVELIGPTPGLGNSRYKARLDDEVAVETWNNTASAWQASGSVAAADALFFLDQEAASEYANVYAKFIAGVGTRSCTVTAYDFVANAACDDPLFQEDVSVVQGGTVTLTGLFHKVEALRAHGVITNATRLNPDREPVLVLFTEAGTAPVLLARIVDGGGTPIVPADISTIKYSIFERRDDDLDFEEHLDGHYLQSLTVADVVLTALQNDYLWDEADDEGYNFRHQPTISSYAALPAKNSRYDFEYTFTPVTGQVFKKRYEVRT